MAEIKTSEQSYIEMKARLRELYLREVILPNEFQEFCGLLWELDQDKRGEEEASVFAGMESSVSLFVYHSAVELIIHDGVTEDSGEIVNKHAPVDGFWGWKIGIRDSYQSGVLDRKVRLGISQDIESKDYLTSEELAKVAKATYQIFEESRKLEE